LVMQVCWIDSKYSTAKTPYKARVMVRNPVI
jgi:hypothetical protein